MFCINLETSDPFFNLALEELLLKTSREEYLILGVNSPSVIIGKHQSPHREVNTKYITENCVPVIRRISGGGTVYHDTGNLNFSFICHSETGKQVDFLKYTRPVTEFLVSLGIEARFEGKNDIRVDGLKISGNAEHVHRNRVLHHGTLLFSSSLDKLKGSIRKDKSAYSTRAVDSNPASVINLSEKLTIFRDIIEFREAMMSYLLGSMPDMVVYDLTQQERDEAEKLAETKYRTWEWNFAYGPEYNFTNSYTINGIRILCDLFVKDGMIRKCNLEGDAQLNKVAARLTGCRHMVPDLLKAFQKENIQLSDEDVFGFF